MKQYQVTISKTYTISESDAEDHMHLINHVVQNSDPITEQDAAVNLACMAFEENIHEAISEGNPINTMTTQVEVI